MSNDNGSEVVLKARQAELQRNVAREETMNLKNSLLFQYNWPELLQSAPTAINSMGACFVAASSSKAVVNLDEPAKGFQYLKYKSLQANLVETANLGRFAFNEAEKGMGGIAQSSDIIGQKLRDVLNIIGDPESARTLLKPQLNAVSKSAATSAEAAKAIEQKFNAWLFYACEMHAACVQQEQTTADVLISNSVCVAAEQARLQYTKDAVESAKSATTLMAKQVETASDAFKQASDEFPTGWDLVGQQIVGDIANCATTALKAAIPALVSSINPVAGAVSQGQSVVGSFINKGADANGANGGNGGASRPKPANADNAKLAPEAAKDPAGAELIKNMTYIELLNTIINGEEGGIDWEKARGATDAKSSVSFVSKMLTDSKTTFSRVATNKEISKSVLSILETTAQVASELNQVVVKSKSMTAAWPASTDPQVKTWVSSFRKAYTNAHQVSGQVAASNGNTGNSQIVSNTETSEPSNLSGKDAQSQMILESAKNRLNTTQQAFLSTQDNYLKASAMLVEQQNKLGEISASLAKLTNSNITLTEIKAILVQAIKLIVQLKNQINDLVRFFSAFSVIINTVVSLHVEPFLDTVKRIVSGNGDDPNASWTVGKYTLTDVITTNLFNAVLTLRAYYSVFGDIAKMWTQLSIESIQPGLYMCDKLSIMGANDSDLKKSVAQLQTWSDEAREKINKTVKDKQSEIAENMESRVTEIGKTTTLLPATPTTKFIEEGKNETTATVAKNLEAKKEAAPLGKRFQVDF